MPRKLTKRQTGFTLLEAIVALVLLASSGMALFSWINSNLIALDRVRDSNARATATLNALEYMDSINPMLSPEGQADLGDYRIAWKAEAVGMLKDGTNYPAGIGLWQFSRYQTHVEFSDPRGKRWFSIDLKQIGYKRVRSLQLL